MVEQAEGLNVRQRVDLALQWLSHGPDFYTNLAVSHGTTAAVKVSRGLNESLRGLVRLPAEVPTLIRRAREEQRNQAEEMQYDTDADEGLEAGRRNRAWAAYLASANQTGGPVQQLRDGVSTAATGAGFLGVATGEALIGAVKLAGNSLADVVHKVKVEVASAEKPEQDWGGTERAEQQWPKAKRPARGRSAAPDDDSEDYL